MLVDVHAHLDIMEDVESVIERCRKERVKIITCGGDEESNKKALEFGKREGVECCIGSYPCEVSSREFIKRHKDKIVGIGEVGLDFSMECDREKQERVFREMIELSKELDLCLVVHSRKAESRVLDLLEEYGAKKVLLHCFCGRKSLIKRGIEDGFYFSIPANVVRAQNFQNLVRMVNINQLLTETDSPFLAPERGESNTPCNVKVGVEKIAEIKGMDVEEIKNNIYMNYQRLFG